MDSFIKTYIYPKRWAFFVLNNKPYSKWIEILLQEVDVFARYITRDTPAQRGRWPSLNLELYIASITDMERSTSESPVTRKIYSRKTPAFPPVSLHSFVQLKCELCFK